MTDVFAPKPLRTVLVIIGVSLVFAFAGYGVGKFIADVG